MVGNKSFLDSQFSLQLLFADLHFLFRSKQAPPSSMPLWGILSARSREKQGVAGAPSRKIVPLLLPLLPLIVTTTPLHTAQIQSEFSPHQDRRALNLDLLKSSGIGSEIHDLLKARHTGRCV